MVEVFMAVGIVITFVCVAFTVGLVLGVVMELIAAAVRETIE